MNDRELMQQALDALNLEMPVGAYLELRNALRDRLAQPEQEPVPVWELQEDGWDTICDGDWLETLPVGTKLYTTPPQRPWVGLTDNEADEVYRAAQEQINEYWESGGSTIMFPTMLYKAIEAKLKEKNI